MNNASLATQPVAISMSPLNIYWQETRYELIKLVRQPLYPISVMGFPILFFLVFGLGITQIELFGHPFSRYLLASYSCFGAIGASLLASGSGVAVERGYGWLQLKWASPMPPAAYLFAKVMAGVLVAIVGTLALILVAALTTPLDVTFLEALHLLAANVACALVFAGLGVALGLVLTPTSAPGMMHMIYLPLSLCGGLWLPLESLPHWMRGFAHFLPSYYASQLSHAALGYESLLSLPALWATNAAFGLAFALAALLIFRHQRSRE
jgi:ABC-2 type transport system permease protein